MEINFDLLLTGAEKSALENAVKKANPRCRAFTVCSFERFGFSGARLLLLYFDKQPYGLAHVAKVNKATGAGARAPGSACPSRFTRSSTT